MEKELAKEEVKKDLESWASKLREINKLVGEMYSEIQEIYKGVTKV